MSVTMRIGRRAPVLHTCQQCHLGAVAYCTSVRCQQCRLAPVAPCISFTCHQPVTQAYLALIQVSNVSKHHLALVSPLATSPYRKPMSLAPVSPCISVISVTVSSFTNRTFAPVPVWRCTDVTFHQCYFVTVSPATSVDYPQCLLSPGLPVL